MDLAHARFGDLLREYRIAAGLSQEGLAERAAVSAVTISSLERSARTRPHKDTIALLADALRLSQPAREELERAADGGRSRHARESLSNNLPTQLSNFVGREGPAGKVEELLANHRLVTLVGAAGIGKTRLALHVASTLTGSSAYAGVWFVDFAPVANGSLVLDTIASVLGAGNHSNEQSLDARIAKIADRNMLLVFDNCEHLIEDVARTAGSILQHSPQVRILATSREALGLSGERTYRVPSLELPPPDKLREMTVVDALSFDAIALFVNRAADVNNQFSLTPQLINTVAQICHRLDGIALAIELVAARTNVLSPAELAEKLHERFFTLAGGSRTALPRHKTMRALIDWSYDLLSDKEQRFLRRLSIFAGGFTQELLSAFCSQDESLEQDEIIELTASLVDKSLVQMEDADDETTSYRLLESTRQYAAEKLRDHGEYTVVARTHALGILALAEQFNSPVNLISDKRFKALTAKFLGNLRAALEWTLVSHGDVRIGQRLAGSLRRPWFGDTVAERRRFISLALETCDEGTPPDTRAKLELADLSTVPELFEARATAVLESGERALRLLQEVDDPFGVAEAQTSLGIVLRERRCLAESKTMFQSALATAHNCGAERIVATATYGLALAHLRDGEAETARSLLRDALTRFQSAECGRAAAHVAICLSEVEFTSGEIEAAVRLCQEAIGVMRGVRHPTTLPHALSGLSGYLIGLGRFEEARAAAREAITLAHEAGLQVVVAWAVQHLAAIATSRSTDSVEEAVDAEHIAQLLGFVDGCLRKAEYERPNWEQEEYDRVRSILQSALGSRLEKLMQVGADWPESRLVAEALKV